MVGVCLVLAVTLAATQATAPATYYPLNACHRVIPAGTDYLSFFLSPCKELTSLPCALVQHPN